MRIIKIFFTEVSELVSSREVKNFNKEKYFNEFEDIAIHGYSQWKRAYIKKGEVVYGSFIDLDYDSSINILKDDTYHYLKKMLSNFIRDERINYLIE